MIKLSDFHYELPPDRIAQEPVSPRDQSRLMVIRADGARDHRRFCELGSVLRAGDVLVTNTTKVFPARLRGKKKTGGKIELLLLDQRDSLHWRALVRGATAAVSIQFPEGLEARMTERLAEGEWVVEFSSNHLRSYLDRHGEMPLPPYIKRPQPMHQDLDRYQTVFAQQEGSVAAPTAGFHFTPALLDMLEISGVIKVEITLHVGWGTFRPVRVEEIEKHVMLPEAYSVSKPSAEALTRARAEGRRIVAVGTTAVRTLETICEEHGHFSPGEGTTNLFIYPGYCFKAVDVLITNFHLSDSTPLLLANAFRAWKAGSDEVFPLRSAYEDAIREGYRFYSYGDAMLIS